MRDLLEDAWISLARAYREAGLELQALAAERSAAALQRP